MSDFESAVARQEGKGLDTEHQKAVDFVEKHRDFFEHYGRGHVHVEPAPPELR